jgi:hypothetical protein
MSPPGGGTIIGLPDRLHHAVSRLEMSIVSANGVQSLSITIVGLVRLCMVGTLEGSGVLAHEGSMMKPPCLCPGEILEMSLTFRF